MRRDREKTKKYNQNYYRRNRDIYLEKAKSWQSSVSGRAYKRAYRASPIGRFKNLVSQAKAQGWELCMTFDQWLGLVKNPCYYCGGYILGKSGYGVDRVSTSKGYLLDNIVPCCGFCNKMKLNHTESEFIEQCKKIVAVHG